MESIYFNKEHKLFRQTLKEFIDKEIRPYAEEWEESETCPREIFKKMGAATDSALLQTVSVGVVNLLFTYIAIQTVDRWGRRKLMMTGSAGLAILYLFLGLGYFLGMEGVPILVVVVASIALYAMTLAPVTWVVLSEIFPNRIRSTAMAAATTMLWVASALLVVTFPYLNEGLKTSGTFWVYAGICLAGFLFIYRKLPETKGKTLEEIEINPE